MLDPRSFEPQLRVSQELMLPPDDNAVDERRRAVRTWRALQASTDEAIQAQADLDKYERAMVATRKQMLAARAETAAAQARAAQAESERFHPGVVVGLGLLTLATGAAWLHQRRRLLALESQRDSGFPLMAGSAQVSAPAVEPEGDSAFGASDITVLGDEVDQWIERSKVAVPTPGTGAQ